MQFNARLRCPRWRFIDARHFNPAVVDRALLDRVARILRLGGRHDAERKVCYYSLVALDLLPRVTAPKHTRQHAAPWHGDVLGAAPRGEAVVLPRRYGKGLLPPAVQPFAFVGANDERAVSRFAAIFRLLKLRANLLARRDSCPPISRGSLNLPNRTNEPRESNDDGFHVE